MELNVSYLTVICTLNEFIKEYVKTMQQTVFQNFVYCSKSFDLNLVQPCPFPIFAQTNVTSTVYFAYTDKQPSYSSGQWVYSVIIAVVFITHVFVVP